MSESGKAQSNLYPSAIITPDIIEMQRQVNAVDLLRLKAMFPHIQPIDWRGILWRDGQARD